MKKIIILVVVGLLSFGISFGATYFMKKRADTKAAAQATQPGAGTQQANPILPEDDATSSSDFDMSDKFTATNNLTTKQLRTLIYDVRIKNREYDEKLKNLKLKEQRLEKANELIREDLEELKNLQAELASTVMLLKDQRSKLNADKVKIEKTEEANLMAMAEAYDAMDPSSASKIMISMTQMPTSASTKPMDDVVKILYYMGGRNKADLLAEMINSKPELAAGLCQKLKKVSIKE